VWLVRVNWNPTEKKFPVHPSSIPLGALVVVVNSLCPKLPICVANFRRTADCGVYSLLLQI
jgi:hypothetical protein